MGNCGHTNEFDLESEADEVMLVIVKIQQSHKPLRDVSVLGKHKFM